MENKADEARSRLSRLHAFKKPFISIIIFISSISLPFQFHSFPLKFINFPDSNDRHHIFLLCNGILVFLFLVSGSNQAEPEARKMEYNDTSVSSAGDHRDPLNTHDQIHDLETESIVHDEHELAMDVRQIEQKGMLVASDDQIEDSDTKLVLDVEDKHKMIAKSNVEEHEDDELEEAYEFHQKCEEFIRKVRQSMHHEGPPPPQI